MGGMQIQMQKRRPFSSLLLGAVGKRGTIKCARPRHIPQNGRKVAHEQAPKHAGDTVLDHDTDSQLDGLEAGSFLPEETPPALDSCTSERSTSHPLKNSRIKPPSSSMPSGTEEDSSTASLTSASKSNNMMASVESNSHQHTLNCGEQSFAPEHCSFEEPRSDDDAATVTGCSLLDLWADPSACEPSAKHATSSSLTASKTDVVQVDTVQPPKSEPVAAPMQVSPALKACPVKHAPGSKRPRVSITLGRVCASPLGKKRAHGIGKAHALLPSHVRQRQITGAKSATKEACVSVEVPSAQGPPHRSTSHNLISGDMITCNMSSRCVVKVPGDIELNANSAPAPHQVAVAPAAVLSAPSDDLPMSVRLDRDIINTMLVTRRTSSRWSEYARDGAPWTLEEEAWLIRHHKEGGSLVWLSEQLSRTRSAVKARLKRRG